MESFLVYLFNFYYAIRELEQNKQNNTIIFFLLFIFLTKKWTSAVCGGGGGAGAPIAPPLPMGLLLCLLLLILFINDLPNVVKPGAKAALYADSTKIYSAVQLVPDCLAVQESLLNMDDWTQRTNMQFNTTKCKVLTVACKKHPLIFVWDFSHT